MAGGEPSRRGLLLLLGTAVCSGVVGYWWRGSGVVRAEPADGDEGGIDYRILWARKMASEETPIEELLGNVDAFVLELMARSFDDPLVWRGAERICEVLYENPEAVPDGKRARIASYLSSTIRAASPPREIEIERFLPTLDRLSR
jgi:hypothetical protein